MSTEIAVQTPSSGFSIVPSNLTEAMRLAEMMSNARLVPQALQKSPADCLLVIEQASRWGMSPFAAAQSVSVIQGKLMFEGKLVAAVINASGNLQERLSYEYEGIGDDRTIIVSGLVKGEKKPRELSVKLKDAKTANKVWNTQPDQQLMYHGARVWARRHMPELMLGVYSPEEFEPISDKAVVVEAVATVVEPAKHVEPPAPANDSVTQLTADAKEMAKELDSADTSEKLEAVVKRFVNTTSALATKLPKWHERIIAIIEKKRAELAPQEEPINILAAG